MSSKAPGRAMRAVDSLSRVLVWGAYIPLAFMVIIVFADVLMRYFFNSPIKGSYELVLLCMTLAGGFAILHTAVHKGHVGVDIVFNKLPKRAKIVLQVFASILGFVTWAALTGWTFYGGMKLVRYGQVTDSLHIKTGPFQLVLAIALALCALVLLVQAIHPDVEEKSDEEEGGAST